MAKKYILFGTKYDTVSSDDVYVKAFADFEGYFRAKDTYLIGIFSEKPDKAFITDLQNRDNYYEINISEFEENSNTPQLISSEYTPE